MDYEILKEENGLRVKLVQDVYAEEPYNDGQCPLLRLNRMGHYPKAEHIMTGGMRPTDDDARIEEAAVHFAGSPDLFEKYLRAFHGATVIKWYGPNQVTDYTYVAYDTPAWVKAIGFDDVISPRSDYDAARAVQMDEFIAFLEGYVYGYSVERLETWHAETDPEMTMETWEDVDSCYGFYGYDHAEASALEAFETAEATKA